MQKALSKKERLEIFKLFLKDNKLKFSQIERHLDIRSNMVSYNLTSMVKDGILLKDGEYYSLTSHAEKYIPLFNEDSDVGPMPVLLVAVMNKSDSKILLVKRTKRPYKDYWSMIGGKILIHEDVACASLRMVKEKTDMGCDFVSLNDVMHERVEGSGVVKHSFILLFAKVVSKTTGFKESSAGVLRWFDLKKIDSEKENIIPSDYWLIKNSLNKKMKMQNLYMHEVGGKIQQHRFL